MLHLDLMQTTTDNSILIMHKAKNLLKDANNACSKADYLTYMTFPLVKEARLLGVILENIEKALVRGVEAVVEYDRAYKRVALVNCGFRSELEIFKSHSSKRHKIDNTIVNIINEVTSLSKARKESAAEFVKNNKYIVYSHSSKMQTLTIEKVKKYLDATKKFLESANKVLQ